MTRASSTLARRCANQYAKPIFMCRKCLLDFLDVRTYYKALEHSEMDGINCKELLTSHDKVGKELFGDLLSGKSASSLLLPSPRWR